MAVIWSQGQMSACAEIISHGHFSQKVAVDMRMCLAFRVATVPRLWGSEKNYCSSPVHSLCRCAKCLAQNGGISGLGRVDFHGSPDFEKLLTEPSLVSEATGILIKRQL